MRLESCPGRSSMSLPAPSRSKRLPGPAPFPRRERCRGWCPTLLRAPLTCCFLPLEVIYRGLCATPSRIPPRVLAPSPEGKVAEERSDEDGWGETLMPANPVICRVPGFPHPVSAYRRSHPALRAGSNSDRPPTGDGLPSCRTYREMRHLEGKVGREPFGFLWSCEATPEPGEARPSSEDGWGETRIPEDLVSGGFEASPTPTPPRRSLPALRAGRKSHRPRTAAEVTACRTQTAVEPAHRIGGGVR